MLKANIINTGDNAAWVVFFHGFGGSGNTWQKQITDYSKHYNLLLLDFHSSEKEKEDLSVQKLCGHIAETMRQYHVEKAHIVSLSSGSLVALAFAALYPEMVNSMVMAGGMLTLDIRTTFLLGLARVLKYIVPYMVLYSFFAYIILPRDNHKKSRDIFVKEAGKLGHGEFCRWLNFIRLLVKNKSYIVRINSLATKIPMLYVMGEEDHLFKNSVIKNTARLADASVEIIPGCGHVCSIENASAFNQISIGFFKEQENILL